MNKLNFADHVAHRSGKATRRVGLIRRSFDYLTEEVLVQLFKSLVWPILEYGRYV